MIVTSNIGCLMHLQKGSSIPVKHWVELLDV
jgi:glycolate oxidase iron-sulfur subunit